MQDREKIQSWRGLAFRSPKANTVTPAKRDVDITLDPTKRMSTHQLDLLQNALDSLAEALAKFQAGDAGNAKAYKFCVLHMAHFIELVFKYHITEKHPLLIFKDPFAQKLDTNKTITLWDAINFINNEESGAVSKDFRADLEWLKRLRNDIEHHKFEMEVQQARITIGRLFRSVREFLENYTDVEVEDHIPDETMETFQVLSSEYEFRLRDALKEAEGVEEANRSYDPSAPDETCARLDCEECGNATMVLNAASKTGYRCTFCKNEEGSDIPATCDICGGPTTLGELVYWETDCGQHEGRCYYCSGKYRMDKDD